MIYEAMNPPFEIESFETMSKKEAQKHFEWYISQIPMRLSLLEKAYKITEDNQINLDFTRESLVNLWKWMLPKISVTEKTVEEIKVEKDSLPEWVADYVEPYKISTETLILAKDVSIYFAQSFIERYPNLSWSIKFKPKNLYCVNRPIVLGFKYNDELWAENILNILVLDAIDGNCDINALANIYSIWAEKLELVNTIYND